jgi:Inner membrane component of T3SS, cytoplasmic domain
VAFALTIAAGNGRGRKFRFDRESVSIGRAGNNDLVLNDAGVSRTHARIERHGASWVLVDRASVNGVELNGAVVGTLAPLREGDRIGVGPVTFEFRISTATRKPAPRCWGTISRPARAGLVAVAVLSAGISARFAMQPAGAPGTELLSPSSSIVSAADSGRSDVARDADRAPPPDLAAARAAWERGRRKLAERRVAPRNLHDAWTAFLEARAHLGGAVDPGLPAGEQARLIEECERDLRRECDRLLFTAARFERYGDGERARQTWREVLLHFPSEDPGGCRAKAKDNLLSEAPGEGSE